MEAGKHNSNFLVWLWSDGEDSCIMDGFPLEFDVRNCAHNYELYKAQKAALDPYMDFPVRSFRAMGRLHIDVDIDFPEFEIPLYVPEEEFVDLEELSKALKE